MIFEKNALYRIIEKHSGTECITICRGKASEIFTGYSCQTNYLEIIVTTGNYRGHAGYTLKDNEIYSCYIIEKL